MRSGSVGTTNAYWKAGDGFRSHVVVRYVTTTPNPENEQRRLTLGVPTFPHPSQPRKRARFGLGPFFRCHRPPTPLSGCCQHPNPENDVFGGWDLSLAAPPTLQPQKRAARACFQGWDLSLAPTTTTPRELDRSLGF